MHADPRRLITRLAAGACASTSVAPIDAPVPAAVQTAEACAQVNSPSPDLSRACGLLGVPIDGSGAQIDAAYLAAVERYNPQKLTELGANFVAMAVRRLAQITAAYELMRGLRANGPAPVELAPGPSQLKATLKPMREQQAV